MSEDTKLPVPGEVPKAKNYLTREERKSMDALSKAVSGKSCLWRKGMERGHVADMEETLEDGTIRKYRGIKRPSLAEVKEIMEGALKEKLAKEKLEAEKKFKAEQEKALANKEKENEPVKETVS